MDRDVLKHAGRAPQRAARLMRVVLAASLVAAALGATGTASAAKAYALGDSVMLGAKTQLEKRGIRTDAAVSRQFAAGLAILKARRDAGTLPKGVVIHLGTNGPFYRKDFDAMMRVLKRVPRVVFLTVHEPRAWQDTVNSVLRAGVARWKNAVLLDWNWQASRHPGWIYSDGIHLQPAGAAAYARLIASKL